MGLDLVAEGCAKPGYEAEWREILARSFDGEPQGGDQERFGDICIPPHERVGAPRVGFDKAADDWILKARNASPAEAAKVIEQFHGYYVLPLVSCDGLPKFTHAGLYDGVDETSFRGSFLTDCVDVLGQGLIDEAWNHKFPEDAIAYGRALLAAAETAKSSTGGPGSPEVKVGLLSRLGLGKKEPAAAPLEDQLEIAEAAGKWYIYWGERGHAIRAWF